MVSGGAVTHPPIRCLLCEAKHSANQSLKGWSMNWCHECNLPVWTCPACSQRVKRLTGRKLVHVVDGSHAMYAQSRF
jgi:hypothetical protein